ncbi:hypothetical protein Abr02nite_57240 [Paractinoplanes brasiliensis]|nr:hypothetical protein Abr02nite_57240 [Actinoplanes brasiliensis]
MKLSTKNVLRAALGEEWTEHLAAQVSVMILHPKGCGVPADPVDGRRLMWVQRGGGPSVVTGECGRLWRAGESGLLWRVGKRRSALADGRL